jgi:hypothetical protein
VGQPNDTQRDGLIRKALVTVQQKQFSKHSSLRKKSIDIPGLYITINFILLLNVVIYKLIVITSPILEKCTVSKYADRGSLVDPDPLKYYWYQIIPGVKKMLFCHRNLVTMS